MTFSLRTLMTVVLVVAIGCAALKFRTPEWACVVLSIALAGPVLIAMESLLTSQDRVPSLAFSLVTLLYLGAILVEPLQQRALALPTSRWTIRLWDKFIADEPDARGRWPADSRPALHDVIYETDVFDPRWPLQHYPYVEDIEFSMFYLSTQSLWGLLFGAIAALAASFVHKHRAAILRQLGWPFDDTNAGD
jgi:hypothetical protein